MSENGWTGIEERTRNDERSNPSKGDTDVGAEEVHLVMVSLSSERRDWLARAIGLGLLDGAPPAALFIDLDGLDSRLASLERAFPSGSLHCMAMKACPLPALLSRCVSQGFGLECASEVELEMALSLCPPDRIVFDSPAKTRSEIERALQAGVRLNVDNLEELRRLEQMTLPPGANVGLRINPCVGTGHIADTSTAMAGSKFGIDLHGHRSALMAAYATHSWLKGLHFHVGSQGCELSLWVKAASAAASFVRDIRAFGRELEWVDVGGGLPVAYGETEVAPTFQELAELFRNEVPDLWKGKHRIITEFGRSIFAPIGWAATKVEYTKQSGDRQIAVTHLGADLLLRPAYRPEQWRHQIQVFDAHGDPREEAKSPWDIAGPLCFSGDLIARQRPLPDIQSGDIVCIEDVGAYALSMWSRYNSRRSPAVYGLKHPDQIQCLRNAETVEQVLNFWR